MRQTYIVSFLLFDRDSILLGEELMLEVNYFDVWALGLGRDVRSLHQHFLLIIVRLWGLLLRLRLVLVWGLRCRRGRCCPCSVNSGQERHCLSFWVLDGWRLWGRWMCIDLAYWSIVICCRLIHTRTYNSTCLSTILAKTSHFLLLLQGVRVL